MTAGASIAQLVRDLVVSGQYSPRQLRLAILLQCRNLGGTSNHPILADILSAYGMVCTREEIQRELYQMAHGGLLTLAHPNGRLVVATLTDFGLAVAEGTERCGLVARLAPGTMLPTPLYGSEVWE